MVRAVRGATTLGADEADLVAEGTTVLLQELISRNRLASDQIVSVVFTVTADIASLSPLAVLERVGWSDVPAICAREIDVPGALPLCIRVLLHTQRSIGQGRLEAVYLERAVALRPDLSSS
jgi:chorismate mutase